MRGIFSSFFKTNRMVPLVKITDNISQLLPIWIKSNKSLDDKYEPNRMRKDNIFTLELSTYSNYKWKVTYIFEDIQQVLQKPSTSTLKLFQRGIIGVLHRDQPKTTRFVQLINIKAQRKNFGHLFIFKILWKDGRRKGHAWNGHQILMKNSIKLSAA